MPIRSWYSVEYWFLSTPYDFRVEAMGISAGESPMHRAMMNSGEKVVHASFRCDNEAEYDRVFDLLDPIATKVQVCGSEYGRFSYWRLDDCGLLVKPRVNTRDSR
jgi:hypothetical protein